MIGPDNNVYTVVGDLEGQTNTTSTKAQNYRDGPEPDGRAGVLRMTQNGQPVNDTGILGDEHPLICTMPTAYETALEWILIP